MSPACKTRASFGSCSWCSSDFTPLSALAKLGGLFTPRLRTWAVRLAKFFAGQGALQALNVLTGFLILRCLSVEDYALFGVVIGFQATLAMVVDLGFGGCIPALTGSRVDQPAIIGGYIAAARAWRRVTFCTVIPPAAVAFAFVGARQDWSWPIQAVLFGSIAATLFLEGRLAWYGAALTMQQRLGRFYRTALESSALRLLGAGVLYALGWLGAVALAFLSVLCTAWSGMRYQAQAADIVREPAQSDPEMRREMVRYLTPLIPSIIFTALQGQILVLLISFFGRTQNIAEVAALGRVGQLFVLLNAFNSVIIGPFFARLPRELLERRYLQVVLGAALFASGLVVLTHWLPEPLLWLLGPKYAHLRNELFWTMLAASTSYLAGVIWTIHSARKWIFWWGGFVYIATLTVVQVLFVVFVPLNTTRNVLIFGVTTGLAVLLIHLPTAIVGFTTASDATPTVDGSQA